VARRDRATAARISSGEAGSRCRELCGPAARRDVRWNREWPKRMQITYDYGVNASAVAVTDALTSRPTSTASAAMPLLLEADNRPVEPVRPLDRANARWRYGLITACHVTDLSMAISSADYPLPSRGEILSAPPPERCETCSLRKRSCSQYAKQSLEFLIFYLFRDVFHVNYSKY